ncbi:uncharacterized protein LOC126794815 [Argentina anserina]|uniref:uncharacterized protein LOC126794815 n=1 Tax=Argentina anserina TaxID=57926 RepID=UPI002176730D|nr:uncharacterized protein LOC126794815 [Potentilla anserina]
MDLWNKARGVAEEAAKRSHDLSFGGAWRLSDIAAEASKRADHIKQLAADAFAPSLAQPPAAESQQEEEKDLEAFGITEELRDFANGITPVTFKDFPIPDDTKFSEVPTVTNVRQDLTEWQTKHASLVLSTVKEISKLRYELCPRIMTERKFWRIYFILVNNHVAPYEKRYLDNVKLMSTEQFSDDSVKEPTKVEITSKAEDQEEKHHSKTSTSATTEQELDAFLLGDSDNDSDNGDGNFDDHLYKLVDGLDEEIDKL